MKSVVVLLAAVFMLGACTGTQQDPLANASPDVREGRLPDASKPVSESPYPKEALQIDSPNVVNGRAGSPLEFVISGRVAIKGVAHTISIDNLAAFPGATFDKAKGLFSWVPSYDVVGSTPSAEVVLKASLATVSNAQNPTVAVERKDIVLVIVNSYTKPIISYINGVTDVSAGYRANFEFEVEDKDALKPEEVDLEARDCVGTNKDSIAHFVEFSNKPTLTAPGKYKGTISLNLSTGAEFLTTGSYCFSVVAVSKFNVVSDVYRKDVNIEAKVKNTKMTNPVAEVPSGQALRFGFTIYDPAGTGEITITRIGDISADLPGSYINCGASKFGAVDCMATIDATNLQPAEYSFPIVTENKSPSLRSNQKTTTNHTLTVVVKAH